MTTEKLDELRELIRSGRVRMMTIDTSIIRQNRLALNQGLLGQLAQFNGSRFSLVMSEVVIREVRRQIVETLQADLASWPKIARRLQAVPSVAVEAHVLSTALESLSSEGHADDEINKFLLATGAEVISASEATLDQVLDLYFERKPPFDEGGKRNEFPDAIALLGIEAWAKSSDGGILVVSGDGDWKRFCEHQGAGHMYLVDSLALALEIINSTAADRDARSRDRQQRLVRKLADHEVIDETHRQLRVLLLEQARAKASSNFAFVADIVRVQISWASFSDPTRIRDDDDAFVVLADMVADCRFWANFNFYDPDTNRFLGKGVYGFGRSIDAAVIITSRGNSVGVEVVLKKEPLVIDFGEVEPDQDGIESHLPNTIS